MWHSCLLTNQQKKPPSYVQELLDIFAKFRLLKQILFIGSQEVKRWKLTNIRRTPSNGNILMQIFWAGELKLFLSVKRKYAIGSKLFLVKWGCIYFMWLMCYFLSTLQSEDIFLDSIHSIQENWCSSYLTSLPLYIQEASQI